MKHIHKRIIIKNSPFYQRSVPEWWESFEGGSLPTRRRQGTSWVPKNERELAPWWDMVFQAKRSASAMV